MRRTGFAVVLLVVVLAAVGWFLVGTSTPQRAPSSDPAGAREGVSAPAPAVDPGAGPEPHAPVAGSVRRSDRALLFAAALDAGELPAAAPLPRGHRDRHAEALAKAIFAGDASSIAALHRAVLSAGYGIRRSDGTVVRDGEPGQGLAFHEWEVAAIAKLYGARHGVTLKHLADAFRQAAPWKDVPFETLFIDGVQRAMDSKVPELRFWAQLIVELGRRADEPYELLAGVQDPAVMRLDPIQLQLLLTRFAADLAIEAGAVPRETSARAAPGGRDAVPAAWRGVIQGNSPCGSLSDGWGVFNDYSAMAYTNVYGSVLGSAGGDAAKVGMVMGLVNAVLSLAKFAITYSLLEVDVGLEPARLFRSKTTADGEHGTLTARVSMGESWVQYVNCIRKTLNENGLDLSVPDAGPLKEVDVRWTLQQGRDDLVVFPSTGNAGAAGQTDGSGVATVELSGRGQKEDLSRRKLAQIDKPASVQVGSSIKVNKLENVTQVMGGLGDLIGAVLGFFGGVGEGMLGVLTEAAYRSTFFGSAEPYEFTVADWEPCENVWSGNIQYTETVIKIHSGQSPRNRSFLLETTNYTATTRIFQSRPDDRPSGMSSADASFTRLRSSTGVVGCFYQTVEETKVSGSSPRNAYLTVSVQPDGSYSVGYSLPIVDAFGSESAKTTKQGQCNNPYQQEKSHAGEANLSISPLANVEIEGQVNPDNPDVLTGARTLTRESGRGLIRARVGWSLRRCP